MAKIQVFLPFLALKSHLTILQFKKHFRRIFCSHYVTYKSTYNLEKADNSSLDEILISHGDDSWFLPTLQ
jgi:hypothetical protein